MKLALKDFQETAVADFLRRIRQAKRDIRFEGDPQAVILSSPTGSGKTVMITAAIEEVVGGNDYMLPEPDAVFLWLSDQPELNRQSKARIVSASSRLRNSDLIIVDADSFDQEVFSGGKVYFLNTQKLGRDKNLVTKGDHRAYTIWETIQNTDELLIDKFYVVVDEAHRGMQKTASDERRAETIIQKFVLGAPGELSPANLIIGISATPQRFHDLLQQTSMQVSRTSRYVNVNPEDVRASGLLKDKIVLYHPEDDQPADWSMLAEAARKWKLMRDRWKNYTNEQHIPPVHPAMVVQVENAPSSGKSLTRTPLITVLDVLETEIGPIKDEEIAHSFQEDKPLEISGHKIRKIEASRIQEDTTVKFIFFKMSLTTGWDCPRAEVMMSFRRARDHTLIAQLVGRMVRTPLARRIEKQEFLNTVALYLPYYDAGGLKRVVDHLRGDPDTVPPTEVERGNVQVILQRRAVDDTIVELLGRLPTYRVKRIRKQSDVRRLIKLSRRLTFHKLDENAWGDARLFVLNLLSQERDRLSVEDSGFEAKVNSKSQITVRPVTIEQGVWEHIPGELERFEVTDANVEDLFKRAGLRLGEGLHKAYWKANVDKEDPNRTKLEMFLILQDNDAWETLERTCRDRINELLAFHKPAIKNLTSAEQEVYNRVREVAKEPEPLEFSPPDEIIVSQLKGEQEYEKHLYVRDDGRFFTKLNSWEDATVREELGRDDVVCWLRNYDRKDWSLSVPYERGGEKMPAYPDFLIIRRIGTDNYAFDLLEPHRPDLEDNWMKAKGLAQFAGRHGLQFERIQLIRIENGRLIRLDINDEEYRERILAVNSNEHLNSVFESLG